MTKKPAPKATAKQQPKQIEVWTQWLGMTASQKIGVLSAAPGRGKEVFYFEYDETWLASSFVRDFDPQILAFNGPQYVRDEQSGFGAFLDASPDRWGRGLMKRREVLRAREEGRPANQLLESDYLLGVHDQHRTGALRLKLPGGANYLDDDVTLSSPPLTSLRELEHASLQLERDDAESDPEFKLWLRMLMAPGGSLGGARPKASVVDEKGHLWIAKFPSANDSVDVGAWELVLNRLAHDAGIVAAEGQAKRLGHAQHTYLTKRFDRGPGDARIPFASAMTLLEKSDGDDASQGVSYLHIAEALQQHGAAAAEDLPQLWRRIVFNILVANTDDHLRNHGFLLTRDGWRLAPAYDLNPNPDGHGLKLNISENDNSLDVELARSVAKFFRVKGKDADKVIAEVRVATSRWVAVATEVGIGARARDEIAPAFSRTA